jgi:hypothetical protein
LVYYRLFTIISKESYGIAYVINKYWKRDFWQRIFIIVFGLIILKGLLFTTYPEIEIGYYFDSKVEGINL